MYCFLGMFTTWRRARQKCKGIRRKSREVKLWALQVSLSHQHHQRQGINAKFVPSRDRGQRNCSACMVIFKTGAFNLHIFICANKFSSVTQSCLILCNPMDSSMPGLPITNSQSLLKLMSIELVIPSNHLASVIPFSSCLQSFPASGSFLMSQLFASGGQNIGVSASSSVLPMNKC